MIPLLRGSLPLRVRCVRTVPTTFFPRTSTQIHFLKSTRSYHTPGPEALSPDLSGLLTPVYAIVSDLFSAVHAVGAPWWIAIPITTITLKAITIASSRLVDRKSNSKFNMARVFEMAKDLNAKRPLLSARQNSKEFTFWMEFWYKCAKKRYNYQNPWRVWPIAVQIGSWLLIGDCLRYMLGAPFGILGRVLPKDLLPQNPAYFLEPSMATEGIPYLCASLVAPDSHHFLPFIFSVVVWANTQWNLSENRNLILSYSSGLLRASYLVPLLASWSVLNLVFEMPAGLLLYWITSNISGFVLNRTLPRLRPASRYKPCTQGFEQTARTPLWLLNAPSKQISRKPVPPR
jgi:membrane protein insertase Oxa1/YidC/SpoIIIJ